MASAATTSKLRILMDERHPAAAVTRAPSASGSSARRWKKAGRECRRWRPTVARVGRERRQWRSWALFEALDGRGKLPQPPDHRVGQRRIILLSLAVDPDARDA